MLFRSLYLARVQNALFEDREAEKYFRRAIEIDGVERSYLVHVPPAHDANRPAPVVLVLHGAGTNARMTVAPEPATFSALALALVAGLMRRRPVR